MPSPSQFVPRRSGAHRIACIALYRALLIQCPRIPLPDDIEFSGPVNPIKHFIRKRFKKNVFHVSPRIVVPALKTGYAAEQLLRSAAEGHAPSITQIHSLLREIHAHSSASRHVTPPMPPRPPKPARYLNAPRVLRIRPIPQHRLSGIRHVPKLVYAAGQPFLRFKRPQSPYLGRILRQGIKVKQGRFNKLASLEDTFMIGEQEERWEDNLKRPFGMEENESLPGSSDVKNWELLSGGWGEVPWQMVSLRSRREIYGRLFKEGKKSAEIGRMMMGIVERERELARTESRERRREKQQERWKKREAKILREKIVSGKFEEGII